jgi:hypothetical protein
MNPGCAYRRFSFGAETQCAIGQAPACGTHGSLRLRRSDRSVVTAGSVGKPNWANWFHRRIAADGRVDLIT